MTDPRDAAALGWSTEGERKNQQATDSHILSRPWPLWKRDEQRKCRAAYVREFYRRRNRGTVFSPNPESACDPDRRAIARVLWSQGFDAALIAEVVGISERSAA